MAPGDLDGEDDVRSRANDDDSERFNLVDARVGRVQRARGPVEPDFPFDLVFELASERLDCLLSHTA